MSEHLPRFATRRSDQGSVVRLLSDWSDLGAYVLLAEPGGGKSCAFEREAQVSGGLYVKARTFANLEPPVEWRGKTIFIDGIDEMRADATSRSGPIDAVIQRLDRLGRPCFRLSCREADWLATVDHAALREVAPGRDLEVLFLDPLSNDDVLKLLLRHSDRVPDPEQFRRQAEIRGLDGLLRNPLLLELLVDAIGNDWPDSRVDVYRLACERMASEHNPVIQAARSSRMAPVDETLRDAGLLCAVLLLAGLDALTIDPGRDNGIEISIQSLPSKLGVKNPSAALSTKLFIADGVRRFVRHRSVAEYLAAQVLGELVSRHGLPLSRVLALMTGLDGGVVEPLRGLLGWLAVACAGSRSILIDRDPLACVLYGDVRSFGVDDKRKILEGFGREAERFAWFRHGNLAAEPFGALGTADMASEFSALLDSGERSLPHQSVLDCVLDAIRHGQPMPQVLGRLELVIRDASYLDGLRSSALDAWLAQAGSNRYRALSWLEEVKNGKIEDDRDELSGRLLTALYPDFLVPAEVMRHFHVSKTHGFVGMYRVFWSSYLIDRTPVSSRPVLVDVVAELDIPKDALYSHFELPGLLGKFIVAGLEAIEPPFDIDRLTRWLRLGLDEYNFAALKGDDSDGIRNWFEQHPDVQKDLVSRAYAQVLPDSQTGRYFFWECEEILYGARRPRDWFRWLLMFAGGSDSVPLVEYCFYQAARCVIEPTSEFDLEMEEVVRWVQSQRDRLPQVDDWLESAWSCPMDDHRRKQYMLRREFEAKRDAERAERRSLLVEYVGDIETGKASPCLMHDLALAYRGNLFNIRGETPEERVREFLAGDAAEAGRAVEGIQATLVRTDIPTVEDILAADLAQQPYYLRAACLLGAKLACDRDPTAPSEWDDELVRRLIAFHLTNGVESNANWYNILVQDRPQVVAEVLGVYAQQCLARRAEQSITGLWPLAREDGLAELARLVLPTLLRNFPQRARSAQLMRLNTELLPAAVRHLQPDELKVIVGEKLAMPCIASSQRLAWLVAGLHFAAHQRSGEIVRTVGTSRARALRLSAVLEAQADHVILTPKLPAMVLGRLIELIAPHTSPAYPLEATWVGASERRRDRVRAMVNQLGGIDDETAAAELQRLRELPKLASWKLLFDAAFSDHVRQIRNSRYAHASAQAVAATLSKDAPANALDLAALVIQHLEDLQAHLLGDDTNTLRRFWRDVVATEPRRPRIENDCRDLIYDKLRERLLLQGVSLSKEATHANDKRADLRAEVTVSALRKVVPIEIKQDNHPEIWTAWRNQLEKCYMTDPSAEGVGIYLVLWFGWKSKANEQGEKPISARDLHELLLALVPLVDRQRLQIHVVDLSVVPPQAKKNRLKRGSVKC